MSKQTQNRMVLEHLKKNGRITSWDAIQKYRVTRLSGRIFDLRRMGYPIRTQIGTTKDGGHYAIYTLDENGGKAQ